MKDPITKNKNMQEVGNDVSSKMGRHTDKGNVTKPEFGRTMGAATKDSRHGIHTDRSASRRTESRRDGSMGSESRPKSQRKNR
jgi:hypothetical protein